MSRFQIGEVVCWNILNGVASGKIIAHDSYGLGLLLVRLRNGRQMIVHESSAEPFSLTVGEC